MSSDDSSYYETTYSEDERIDMYIKEKRARQKEQRAQSEAFRKRVFESVSSETEIFNLPGLEFRKFAHNRVKFSFEPHKTVKYVSKKVKFYCSLRFILNKFWIVKRDSFPANYKWRIYRLFYINVDDNHLLPVLHKIYNILVDWAKKEENFRLNKRKRYLSHPCDLELDTDDEELFLTEKERTDLYLRKISILKRMLPPKPNANKRRLRMRRLK